MGTCAENITYDEYPSSVSRMVAGEQAVPKNIFNIYLCAGQFNCPKQINAWETLFCASVEIDQFSGRNKLVLMKGEPAQLLWAHITSPKI